MISHYNVISDKLGEFAENIGKYSIKHSAKPVSMKDVSPVTSDTIKWDLVDIITITNHETSEILTFEYTLLEIPYRDFDGYKLNNRRKQITNRYDKAKGWHYMKAKSDVENIEVKKVQFSSAFKENEQAIRNYEIAVNKHTNMLILSKSGKSTKKGSVPLSIFLKALTGKSFNELLLYIDVVNSYTLNTFGIEEPNRMECINLCLDNLLNNSQSFKYNLDGSAELLINRFKNLFIGSSAYISDEYQRIVNQVSFKHLKDYVLSEELVIPHTGNTLPEGTLLTLDLLKALDYSSIDKISCKELHSAKSFTFKKYGSYSFRIPFSYSKEEAIKNGKPVLTIDDMENASASKETSITINDTLVIRDSLPTHNSENLIFSMLNIYLNYLAGFPVDDSDYGLNHQSVISLEKVILDTLTENLTLVNESLKRYSHVASEEDLLLKSFPQELPMLDKSSIINEFANMQGKTTPLANAENMLASIAQEALIVKDISSSPEDMDYLQPSQICRFDPFEVPENENIGTTHNKTFLAKVDLDSQLKAPFVKVTNGEMSVDEDGNPKVIYLSVEEEQDKYICEWNEIFSIGDDADSEFDDEELLTARCNGELLQVSRYKINYMEASCYQHMSASRSLSPFPESMSGKRALMASSQSRQSIPILGSERPLVNSGTESILSHIHDTSLAYYTAEDLVKNYSSSLQMSDVSLDNMVLSFKSFTDIKNDRSYKFVLTLENGVEEEIVKILPYSRVSTQKTIYGYSLYTEKGTIYKKDDIVFYSMSYDPTSYPADVRNDFVNTGAIKYDDNTFDGGLALGINLHVGYMTYGSSSIDDAIVINDKLVTEDNLTSIIIHKEDYEIKERDDREEFFGFHNLEIAKGFDQDGLPVKGTYLEPGATVIYKYMKELETSTFSGHSTSSPTNVKLPPTVYGEVISTNKVTDKQGKVISVTVYVVSLAKVEVGDKMAGRYGNKGVIGKIVPNHEMPFDTKSGKPLDIILNPLGIPSRINPSQVLEVTLAACNKNNGTISVVTPFYGNMLENIKSQAEANGIKPIHLLNPINGVHTDYAVHVGEIYMYRLYHRASTKIRSLNTTREVDFTFKQATGTGIGKEKGQAIGEMESWCYLSYGANKLLQEMQTVLSTDLKSLDNAKQHIIEGGVVNSSKLVTKNDNDAHLLTLIRALGINLVQDEEDSSKMIFSTMTTNDIMGLNTTPIDIENPEKSLRSKSIFKNSSNSEEWSWIPLECEIINPFWLVKGSITKTIRVLVKDTQKKVTMLDSAKEDIIPLKEEHLGNKKADNLINQKLFLFKIEADWVLLDQSSYRGKMGITGMPALVKLFREYNFMTSIRYLTEQIAKKGVIEDSQLLNLIESFKGSDGKYSLEKYIIRAFPVLPLRYRPESIIPNKPANFDYFYLKISNLAKSVDANDASSISYIYNAIKAFMGFVEKKENIESGNDNIITYFSDKKKGGRIRGKMAKKRIHRSGRGVLVPFGDITIPPTYIGLPYLVAKDIFGMELTHALSIMFSEFFENLKITTIYEKEKWTNTLIELAIIGDEKQLQFYLGSHTKLNNFTEPLNHSIVKDAITTEKPVWNSLSHCIKEHMSFWLKDKYVVFGRQPSLHKHSARSFKVKLVEGKAIHVHPLVCPGFNADFDGDTGYVTAPLSQDVAEETNKLMSVEASIINSGNGDNILAPAQDILLGNYYATCFKNNILVPTKDDVNPIAYSSLAQINLDLEAGIIYPHQWVGIVINGRSYISTAGRIIFNSLIPNGFTDLPYEDKYNLGIGSGFSNLKYDCIISGRVSDAKLYASLPAIFNEIYEDNVTDKVSVIKYYQVLSEFGFKWSERSGISFKLDDLEDSKLVSDFVEKAKPISKYIDKLYAMGLMSKSDREKAFSSLYEELRSKDFRKNFMNSFSRTNNLFMMFDSKAKGSEDQILQTCGLLGVLQKTKTSSLEVPIVRNYATGLSSFDCFQTAYSTRLGMISTIRGTSEPGELTRTLVYEFNGIQVTQDNCGFGNNFVVPYELVSQEIKLNGDNIIDKNGITKPLEPYDLYGVKSYDEYLKPFIKDGLEYLVLNNDIINEIKEAGVPWFSTEKGIVSFDVKFPKFLESLLLYRHTTMSELDNLLEFEQEGNLEYFISNKTIKKLIEDNPRVIDVSLLSNCFCDEGICSLSYGLYYDRVVKPLVNESPGFEAAQAIGEPSAQLTISLVNKGGKAGESIADGVSVVKSAMQHAKLPENIVAFHSPINGIVTINSSNTSLGLETLISISNNDMTVSTILLGIKPIVRSGNYVTIGQALTEGELHPIKSYCYSKYQFSNSKTIMEKTYLKEGILNPSKELLTRIRYDLAYFYGKVYENNSINILSRHLEYTAFAQTTHGICVESRNPEFIVGNAYHIGSLINAENIDFVISLQNAKSIIQRNSGILTAMCYQDVGATLGIRNLETTMHKEKGWLGSLLTGADLSKPYPTYKPLVKIKSNNLYKHTLNKSNSVIGEDTDFTNTSIKTRTSLRDLLGKKNKTPINTENKTPDETTTSNVSDLPKTGTLDVFTPKVDNKKNIIEDININSNTKQVETKAKREIKNDGKKMSLF